MTNALWITVLGFGITFGAIVVFWGLMSLMTVFPAKKVEADSPAPAEADEGPLLAQAAAAAVALALAEQKGGAKALPVPPTAIVSAWQLGMRTRQMMEKGSRLKVQG